MRIAYTNFTTMADKRRAVYMICDLVVFPCFIAMKMVINQFQRSEKENLSYFYKLYMSGSIPQA